MHGTYFIFHNSKASETLVGIHGINGILRAGSRLCPGAKRTLELSYWRHGPGRASALYFLEPPIQEQPVALA